MAVPLCQYRRSIKNAAMQVIEDLRTQELCLPQLLHALDSGSSNRSALVTVALMPAVPVVSEQRLGSGIVRQAGIAVAHHSWFLNP